MAAAPQRATFAFRGLETGRVYNVDSYLSDVANAQINLDSGNGAGTTSLTYYKIPEKATLIDFSIVTGMTDTTNIALTSDGAQIPGARLRYANFLNTLSQRAPIQVTFARGSNFGAIQVA